MNEGSGSEVEDQHFGLLAAADRQPALAGQRGGVTAVEVHAVDVDAAADDMFRPRDSHDLRVLATDLDISPDSSVRLIQDPLSNSVALVQPLSRADKLEIVCSFRIEHAHSNNLELPLAKSAELYPFAYTIEERYDLEHYLRPYHDDTDGELTAWMCHVEDHHPELNVQFDRCRVRFSTHSAGGISTNDFICAAKADALVAFLG